MKVIAISGSPRKEGNTDRLLGKFMQGAQEGGHATAFYSLEEMNIHGCKACYACMKTGSCVQKDDMQTLYKEILEADHVAIGFPVYMFQMTAQTKLMMDRFFAFLNPDFTSRLVKKPGLSIFVTNGGSTEEMLQPYFDLTTGAFSFLGFDYKGMLHTMGNAAPNEVENKPEVMAKAFEMGKNV